MKKSYLITLKKFHSIAVAVFIVVLLLCAADANAGFWTYTWKGANPTSSDWNTGTNWTVPDENPPSGPNANGDESIISPPVSPNAGMPVITTNINLFNVTSVTPFGSAAITIKTGAKLTINAGVQLTCGKIYIEAGGELENNGILIIGIDLGFTGSDGTLTNNGTYKGTGTVQAVSILGAGTFTFGGKVTAGNINIDGLCIIAADITTTGAQTYAGAVTLGAGTAHLTAENNPIHFKAVINGTIDESETIILQSGSGGITFDSAVGNIIRLDTIHIISNGAVTQGGVFSAAGLILQGAGTYTLTQNNSVSQLLITSGGATDGNITLKNTKDLTAAGIERTNDVTLELTHASAELIFDTNPVTITGSGSLTINLASRTGGIYFDCALTTPALVFTSEGSYDFAVNNSDVWTSTITNQIDFKTTGTVTLNTSSSDILNVPGGFVFSSTPERIYIGGTINYGSNIVFTAPVETNAGSTTIISTANNTVSFNNTLNDDGLSSPNNIRIQTGTGTAIFNGAIGNTAKPASFFVTASSIVLNGGTVTTTGAQTYTGAVTLGADTALVSNFGGIVFSGTGSTVNSDAAVTPRNFSLSAGTGNVIFGGAVGGTHVVNTITIGSHGTVTTSDPIRVAGNWNNTSGKTITISEIEFAGTPGSTSQIIGQNIFTQFNCWTEQKTLLFPNTLTTVRNFDISVASGKEITLQGTAGATWPLLFTGTTGTLMAPNMRNIIVKNSRLQSKASGCNSILVMSTQAAITSCIDNPNGAGGVSWIFISNGVKTWTGTNGTAWNDAGNWTGGVPNTSDDVMIPTVTNQPNITGSETVSSAVISGDILSISGSLTISSTLTILDAAKINAPVAVNGTTTILAPAKTIEFNNDANTFGSAITVSNAETVALKATGNLTLGDAVLSKSLTIHNTGTLTLGDSTSTADTAAYDITAPEGFEPTGATSINLAADIQTTNKRIQFSAPVTLTGSVALHAGVTGADITFANGITQNGTSHALILTAGTNGTITFGGAVGALGASIGNLNMLSAKNVSAAADIFAEQITLSAGTGNNTFTGKLNTANNVFLVGTDFTFSGGIQTGTTCTITNSGSLTVNGAIHANNGFAQNGTGTASLGAGITTVNTAVFFASPVTLTAGISVSTGAGAGNITFNFTVNGTTANTEDLTLAAGTGDITFNEKIGATIELKTININSAKNVIAQKEVSASSFNQVDGSGYTFFASSVSTTNSLSLKTTNIQFGGNVTADSLTIIPKTAGTDGDVYITGASTFNIGNTGATEIKFPANLFIAAGKTGTTDNMVSFNNSITAKNSFVLFSGAVTLGGNITASGDIVLLGAQYQKGGYSVADLFTYNNNGRSLKTANPSITLPASKPDGAPLPKETDPPPSFSGTFAVNTLAGKILSAGKNFYANGVDLTANPWTLSIPDNAKATDSFAEMYNLEVTNCTVTNNTSGGTWAWVSAAELTGSQITASTGNTNIAFSRPQFLLNDNTKATGESLSGTYTIYDDVIRVEFVDSITGSAIKIENDNNEIWKAIENIKFNGNTITGIAFTGSYTNPECTTSTNGAGDLSIFYLKTDGTDAQRWNTDATGTGAGAPHSTDRGRPGTPNILPTHRSIIPSIDIPAALTSVYQTLRDEHKNRISTVNFTQTADRCRPVVVEVRTGQEVHKPFASQKPYDAHNFIEIRYSEEVVISGLANNALNVRSTADFGSIDGASGVAGLQIAGIATIDAGRLATGSRAKDTWIVTPTDNSIHALYRSFSFDGATDSAQTHRLRLAIAGWQDGNTVLPNAQNVPYYPGFIDTATVPAATAGVTIPPEALTFITDNAAYKNQLEPTANGDPAYGPVVNDWSYAKASIRVNEAVTPLPLSSALYGDWDTKPPVPARVEWTNPAPGDEIIGSADSAGFITQFEFHFFDNEPNYATDTPTWNWRSGWNVSGGIRPDTKGGSRPEYASGPAPEAQTGGGIRAGSLAQSWNSFLLYDETNTISNGGFLSAGFERFVSESYFFGNGTNTAALNGDTLYFSAVPQRTNLAARNTYYIRYNNGYITDLAGNRAKNENWLSTDRIPPKIALTLTPLNDQFMLVYFNKAIDFSGTIPDSATEATIHNEFIFYDSAGNLISDLSAVSARIAVETTLAGAIVLELSRSLSYSELVSLYVSLQSHFLPDPITGNTITASNITDAKKNWMKFDVKIPVTFFGVNMARPLFAANNLAETSEGEFGTVTIREPFNGTGSLLFNREIFMQVALNFTPPNPALTLDLIIDTNPVPDSVSVLFNLATGKNIQFWLPTQTPPLEVFASSANTKALPAISQKGSSGLLLRDFSIPVTKPPRTDGNVMQFLFQYGTFKTPDINGNLTVDSPFYLIPPIRRANPLEFSLFAFKALDINRQRGGSTILNNVINTNAGDEAVLEVIMPQAGNLNISVMTLDGNIITYLHRGRAEKGTHYFRWNGTNGGGRTVARGMYFVRISGTGVDETRKVMVVRE